MRNESRVYLGIGSFFVLILVIYFVWSRESTGSVLLLASAGLGLLPGLYIGWWSRRMQQRPEDIDEVAPRDITGVVGQFPENTIFPFTLGVGAWLVGLAFVFGLWFAIIGLGFVFGAAIGATLESKRASLSERENRV
ncbi:MAG: aa3-type cytochrome oxidase subunit IV [Ferrimicrobium sp.]|uniref:cytochrome-c oxidase n=1 Tax=Ferrimicrobium acidiphilum TaxID=121039 RepID=A0ABV3Y212_9ACTN